ncbi:hypothetical protein, partial [Tahibacter aquaticus]|uniref:hypothetical protein n=1 Tax=Tahibacter aquaticus TaxID=520092 RepID=UPI001AAD2617
RMPDESKVDGCPSEGLRQAERLPSRFRIEASALQQSAHSTEKLFFQRPNVVHFPGWFLSTFSDELPVGR